jgi:hypothetical protein
MLASLVSTSPHATAIRAKFAELGGIARVMGALDAFPRDRELVEDAVDALKCLMIGDKARTAQIIAMGGMERVLMAMDNHPDGGLGVRYHAVSALHTMSLAGQDAQQRLAALGVVARVRAAMAAPDVHKGTTEYGQKLLARLPAVDLAQQEAAPAHRPMPPASRQPTLSKRKPCFCNLPKWASPMGAQTRSCSRS